VSNLGSFDTTVENGSEIPMIKLEVVDRAGHVVPKGAGDITIQSSIALEPSIKSLSPDSNGLYIFQGYKFKPKGPLQKVLSVTIKFKKSERHSLKEVFSFCC
jgi:hypothetical protein